MMCFLMTVLGSWGVRNTASQPIYDCHDHDLSLKSQHLHKIQLNFLQARRLAEISTCVTNSLHYNETETSHANTACEMAHFLAHHHCSNK